MFDSHKVAGVISCNPLIFSCSGRRSLPVFVPRLRLGTRKKSAQADFVCIAAISRDCWRIDRGFSPTLMPLHRTFWGRFFIGCLWVALGGRALAQRLRKQLA
jgi:hypothetical protein